MAFVRAGDLVVHYELSGPPGRPAILFANSLGTNFHVWDAQAAALGDRFRILRYDMRGHGLTDCARGAYTIAQLADDARALLDVLRIGRSMSAACRSAAWSPSASRRQRPTASCRWRCATPPTASARRAAGTTASPPSPRAGWKASPTPC